MILEKLINLREPKMLILPTVQVSRLIFVKSWNWVGSRLIVFQQLWAEPSRFIFATSTNPVESIRIIFQHGLFHESSCLDRFCASELSCSRLCRFINAHGYWWSGLGGFSVPRSTFSIPRVLLWVPVRSVQPYWWSHYGLTTQVWSTIQYVYLEVSNRGSLHA